MSTGQFGYGVVPGCCVDPVCGYQILSPYFYVSQVSRQIHIETKQCNLDRLKGGLKRDTNKTSTCAVPMHTPGPQTNALWWGEKGGTTKALFYTLPRRVRDVEGRAVLSDAWDKPRCARWQAVYKQNRDGYEVQGCGWGGGGSSLSGKNLANNGHSSFKCRTARPYESCKNI